MGMHGGILQFCGAQCGSYHIYVGDLLPNSVVARLPPNSTKRYWATQAYTWTLCNTKVGTSKDDNFAPIYISTKKSNIPPTI